MTTVNELRRRYLSRAKRIVVKIGSKVLVEGAPAGVGVNPERIATFAHSMAELVKQGKEVVVVTSGAVGAGMGVLGFEQKPQVLAEKQACAAIGQVRLMQAWENAFAGAGLAVAQILCSADDFRNHERYRNIRATVKALLAHQVVPVINENDTVATAEIKVGDNDKLSADVTQFLDADLLILFTDEKGLYDKNPKEHADAQLIPLIPQITHDVLALAAGEEGSSVSTGGMKSKLSALKQATQAGCAALLSSGYLANPFELVQGYEIGTFFLPSPKKLSSKKRWMSLVSTPRGAVLVDSGAVAAMVERGSSLLSVGIVGVEGRFSQGDFVEVKDLKGKAIARGIVRYHWKDILAYKGLSTQELREKYGEEAAQEVIHRDQRVLI